MIFVNGATDTPGCIAGAVVSGSLGYKHASALCAVGNVLGTVVSCVFFPHVARTVTSLAELPVFGIVSSIIAAVVFSSAAWVFGIPTSESHGLIASIGGALLYLRGYVGVTFAGIVSLGFLSCAAGALTGYLLMLILKHKKISEKGYPSAISFAAFGSSFCHGAQDGQKFAALLALAVTGGRLSRGITLLAAAVLGSGCFFGGKKMINKLGGELAGKFNPAEAVSSDSAAFICTVISSIAGIPVSTTYMKTFAMVGAARAGNRKADVKTLGELIFAWILTYPVCMALSYVLCAAVSHFA